MSDTNTLIIAALAAVLAAMIVVLAVSFRQGARMRRENERLYRKLRADAEHQENGVERLSRSVNDQLRQVAEMHGSLNERMDELTRRTDRRMEEMRGMVGDRLTESFKAVNAQLADVHRGLGEMRALSANVTDLKRVLGNVKTRGVWGEALLRSIMNDMFSPDQFIENAAIPADSRQRVEFALKLPNADDTFALLPIDSKFPQEDYIRLAEATDPMEREKSARALERAVLEQAKIISEKYIRPPQTVDFAVLFLPAEGLYAEVARIPGMIERAQSNYRVLISGPGTLCALLSSLQMGMRTHALEKRSGEILNMLDELRSEFEKFQSGIHTVRTRLEQTQNELDTLESRARKIMRKLM